MSERAHLVAALALVALTACDGDKRPSPSPAPPTTAPVAEDLTPIRHPAAARIVAIGDVHGDLDAARAALRLAGAIDDAGAWIGKDLVVVQTGDQIDRGDDDRAILDLFDRLADEAKKAGGALVPLNGNHEVMNVAGDFRYVTKGAFRAFDGAAPVVTGDPKLLQFPEPYRARAAAFVPGGPYAKLLAKRSIAAIVGDTAFVHGGILPSHLRYGLVKMDRELRAWMEGASSRAPSIVTRDDAPTWARDYSEPKPSAKACEMLDEALAGLGAKRMVVGHTVQEGINSACGDKVWRIDVGMSAHYKGDDIEVLEISGGQVRPLRAPKTAPAH